MKVAVIGSRGLTVDNLADYLPEQTAELVSGGAKGIDRCAKRYAEAHHIKFTEFLPDYGRFKRAAPLKRNEQIVEYSDFILAIWDGTSRGTKHVIEYAFKKGKHLKLIQIQSKNDTHRK